MTRGVGGTLTNHWQLVTTGSEVRGGDLHYNDASIVT